ncbi:MAG: YwqG family protein [Anaerolineae bacterium]
MGYLNNQQINNLDKLISKYELNDFRDQILRIAKTSIQITPAEPHHYQAVGTTRIGGRPDLPMNIEWPRIRDLYLVFLAQINLSEIRFGDKTKAALTEATQLSLLNQGDLVRIPYEHELLPKTGMLYFFLGSTKNYHNIEHRVIYVPEIRFSKLGPPQAPDKETMIKTDRGEWFMPYSVNLQPAISLPMFFYREFESELDAQVSEYQYENFMELCDSLNNSMGFDLPASRLLGYPYSPDVDWQLGDHLHIEWKLSSSKLRGEFHQWSLLFELHSHDETNMYWGDWGKLAFMIRHDHLAQMDFSHTFLTGFSH